MASTYSAGLRFELPANGDQSGTWGATVNTNLGTLVEGAIAGYASVAVASASQALTASNGVTDQARMALIKLTGSAGAATLYTPPASKEYTINNATNGIVTVSNATTAGGTTATGGSTVAIPIGATRHIYSDATNFFFAENGIGVANGGTGAATFTSGGLLVGNGTAAVGTASAAQIVAAIGATAVANATNSTTATSATTAGTVTTAAQPAITSVGTLSALTVSATITGSVSGSAGTATTATNLAGGSLGTVPYQSAAGTTAMLAAGTSGQVLTSAGSAPPTWTTPTNTTISSDAQARAWTDDTTAISPLKLVSALQGSNQSLAANGYQKLPGGLIIQWGSTSALVTNTDTAITFPTAFPTACLTVTMTRLTALGSNEHSGQAATAVTTSGFTARQYSSAGTSAAHSWIAIGY
jgi:hypothetical protein